MNRILRPARRWALGALAAGVIVVISQKDDGPERGLPAVTLPALTGTGELALGELREPVVLNLWATWCGPCRRELPEFQAASEKHDDVRFIGVDIGEDPADAEAFLDELGVRFEQYADRDSELADALGVAALPVTIVVDTSGSIALEHLGPMSREELDAAIADL